MLFCGRRPHKREIVNITPCPLVLIPGFMLDETLWQRFQTCLPAGWPVLHGALSGGKTIRDIARHLAETLPPRFVLVGFSLGGYIARQLAADYPQRVAALVLVASSLREDTEQQMASKQQAVQSLSAATFSGLSRTAIAGSLHPDRAADTALIAAIRQMGNRLGYAALVNQSALRRADVPAAAIRCPTLVVAGAQDALRSLDEAQELTAAIAGATLQVLDGSGHMLPLEQPQALADTLVRWLNEQGID